jgi:hypothetical protein
MTISEKSAKARENNFMKKRQIPVNYCSWRSKLLTKDKYPWYKQNEAFEIVFVNPEVKIASWYWRGRQDFYVAEFTRHTFFPSETQYYVPAIFDYECLERAFEKLSALVARLDP